MSNSVIYTAAPVYCSLLPEMGEVLFLGIYFKVNMWVPMPVCRQKRQAPGEKLN